MPTPAVILDTNVFVAAGFNADSASRRIINMIADDNLILVWNDQTRHETLTVVNSIPPLHDHDFAPLFTERGRFDGPTHPDDFQAVEDPTDRKFAALAHAADVVLVSADGDLLGPRAELPITVLRPSEFVES